LIRLRDRRANPFDRLRERRESDAGSRDKPHEEFAVRGALGATEGRLAGSF